MKRLIAAAALAMLAPLSFAQAVQCPEKNINYWQAFPPGGESDLSARHQQLVLHKKCPSIDTIIQYKAGAGGALMWTQMNQLPADGTNVVASVGSMRKLTSVVIRSVPARLRPLKVTCQASVGPDAASGSRAMP